MKIDKIIYISNSTKKILLSFQSLKADLFDSALEADRLCIEMPSKLKHFLTCSSITRFLYKKKTPQNWKNKNLAIEWRKKCTSYYRVKSFNFADGE